jgi:hypothetical protein
VAFMSRQLWDARDELRDDVLAALRYVFRRG